MNASQYRTNAQIPRAIHDLDTAEEELTDEINEIRATLHSCNPDVIRQITKPLERARKHIRNARARLRTI